MKTTTTETSIPEEKTTSARIQAYSKSQLAALYLPHIQPASAAGRSAAGLPKTRNCKRHSPVRDIPEKQSC